MSESMRNREWLRAYVRAERAGLLEEYIALRKRMAEAQQALRALSVGAFGTEDALDAVAQCKREEIQFHKRVRDMFDRQAVAS